MWDVVGGADMEPLLVAVHEWAPDGRGGGGALEGKGPQRPQRRRLDRRLEEVAKAVRGGYCRLQMPLRLALAVKGTVAGHRLGALEGGYDLIKKTDKCKPLCGVNAFWLCGSLLVTAKVPT